MNDGDDDDDDDWFLWPSSSRCYIGLFRSFANRIRSDRCMTDLNFYHVFDQIVSFRMFPIFCENDV